MYGCSAHKGRRGRWTSGTGVTGSLVLPRGCWDLNADAAGESNHWSCARSYFRTADDVHSSTYAQGITQRTFKPCSQVEKWATFYIQEIVISVPERESQKLAWSSEQDPILKANKTRVGERRVTPGVPSLERPTEGESTLPKVALHTHAAACSHPQQLETR